MKHPRELTRASFNSQIRLLSAICFTYSLAWSLWRITSRAATSMLLLALFWSQVEGHAYTSQRMLSCLQNEDLASILWSQLTEFSRFRCDFHLSPANLLWKHRSVTVVHCRISSVTWPKILHSDRATTLLNYIYCPWYSVII